MSCEFDPTLPLAKARTIPSDWYFDPIHLDGERSTVFAGWQCVGRLDQLDRPGSYLTADVAGEPIAVVRDEIGALRAFFNVCRHRAAPILTQPCGQAQKLRCRYHGWTYDLTGRLRGTPEFDGVEEFDRDENGLIPLRVETWGPTVWVNSQADCGPLLEFLSPMPARTEVYRLPDLQWHARKSYDLNCNWKVYVDNYLDGGYHVNSVHPGLAGVLDYSQYRTELYENSNVQISPLKASDQQEGSVRVGREAQYWWVFPNFMANFYEGVLDTNLVLPLEPERCRVIFDFYFVCGTSRDFAESSVAVGEQIQQEDIMICEQVQRGLHSRSFSQGRFSVRRENGGYQFHQLLARHMSR